MEHQRSSPPNVSVGAFFQNLSWLMAGGVMMAGLFVGTGFWQGGAGAMRELRQWLNPPPPEPQVDVQSVVVQQVQGLSELSTAMFTMQAVVPTRRDRVFAGYTVGSTTLLYIAQGQVRAGVDLSQISREDVQLAGDRSLTLQLPPPQILDSKIDVTRSQVYDYDRGFLGLGPDAAPELQQAAQTETLEQIILAACTEGILQEANTRAQLAVTQLLTTTGYTSVTVLTQAPPPGTCPAPGATPNPVTVPPGEPTPEALG